MENFFTAFVVLIFLSGCAATGPKYAEQVSQLPAVKDDSARLFVFRTGEFSQYSGRAASVKLDGASIGKCDYKGFNIFDVPASAHVLTVDMWDSPGTCSLKIEIAPRNEYYYEITPRTGNLVGLLVGGVLGAAVESVGKECGGAFMIRPIASETAKAKLIELNLTN